MALTLQQQVAQMIVVRASGHLLDSQAGYPQWEWPRKHLEPLIHDVGVGGVLLFGGTVADVALRIRQFQSWADIPLLVCADVEAGVGQRFKGATQFPPAIALSVVGDRGPQYARQMGQITAKEAAAIGINWLLAPVVDVQSNPQNPVIDIRAFDTDPEAVATLTTAFIAGAQTAPVLTTAKHFPGHGDTATDSHISLPSLPHDLDRLRTVEWLPFQQAIAAGVNAIMSAHLMVPALDPNWPATLSPTILQGVIRDEWHYSGLIVTDALTMGAIAQLPDPDNPGQPLSVGEIAVRAVEAGSDILVMPPDPVAAITAITEAVNTGRISHQRIEESLERIFTAKQSVISPKQASNIKWEELLGNSSSSNQGIPQQNTLSPFIPPTSLPTPTVLIDQAPPSTATNLQRLLETSTAATQLNLNPIDLICETVGSQESLHCAEAIARAAVGGTGPITLPLSPEPTWLNWVWHHSLPDADFINSRSAVIASGQGLQTLLADVSTPLEMMEGALDRADGLVVQLFVQSGPFRGVGGLEPMAQRLLVERWHKVKALVCYGSRSTFDLLANLAVPHQIPCLYASDRREVAQQEIARMLWTQPTQATPINPEA